MIIHQLCSQFSYFRGLSGTSHVDVVHRGLKEGEHCVETLIIAQTENEMDLEELVECRQRSVSLARN